MLPPDSTSFPVLPELREGVWPGLYPYQKGGTAKAVLARNLILAWACGSGKTLGALTWGVAGRDPLLIVTRGSVREQWDEETRAFTHLDPFVLRPRGEREDGDETLEAYLARCRYQPAKGAKGIRLGVRPVIIAGWSSLQDNEGWSEIQGIVRRLRPAAILDEIHVAKDYKRFKPRYETDGSTTFVELETLAARTARLSKAGITRRLGLTATPIPNLRRDLWSQLDIVIPGSVGTGFWPWAKDYCGAYKDSDGRWHSDGESNTDELATLLARHTHLVTADQVYQGLPPCTRILTTIPVEWQDPVDDNARKEALAAMKRNRGDGEGGGEAQRAALFAAASTRKRSYIVRRLVELLAEGKKVLVFTGLRKDTEILLARTQRELDRLGAQAKVWAADGSTSPRDREKIRRAYMAEAGPSAIIGTGASWGESANLQHTNHMLIVSLPWTWGQIRQWEGRVRRKRQDRPVTIEYLAAEGTVDMRVFPRVAEKLRRGEGLLADNHVADVRAVLVGGTDEELIDNLLDRFMED